MLYVGNLVDPDTCKLLDEDGSSCIDIQIGPQGCFSYTAENNRPGGLAYGKYTGIDVSLSSLNASFEPKIWNDTLTAVIGCTNAGSKSDNENESGGDPNATQDSAYGRETAQMNAAALGLSLRVKAININLDNGKNSLANLSLLDNDIGFILMNSGCMKYGGTSGELSLIDRSAAGANFQEVIVPLRFDRKG